jgi:hypothetical protein
MADNPIFIEVQKHLGGVDYPASRDELVAAAQESGADEETLQALRDLPAKDYEDPTDVSAELGG